MANGAADAPHAAQRTASAPIPSMTVASSSAPQPGQTFAQYGSPLKRPSTMRSLPEEDAIDVTSIDRMEIAIASPISAPSTFTGSVTS